MENRVVVLGSLNVDHTLWVARLPEAGESVLANDYTLTLGGKGFNQAVTVARQGAPVSMVGCVGDDEEGDWIIETLAAEEVATDLVVHHASLATGRAHITVGADGSNTVVVAPAANAGITFPSAALDGAGVLLAQLECPLEVVGAALAAAKAAGIVTVLNAAPAVPLATELLALIDYLVVNESEARIVAADPVGGFPGTLIITLGGEGASVAKADRRRRLRAVTVDKVVDPTGAGDAFCGTVAAGLALGWPFGEVLIRAAAAGAHAVTVAGALPSLPRATDVDMLLGATRPAGSR